MNANTSVTPRSIHLCGWNAASTALKSPRFAYCDHPRPAFRAQMVFRFRYGCTAKRDETRHFGESRKIGLFERTRTVKPVDAPTSQSRDAGVAGPVIRHVLFRYHLERNGWGARIRNWECRYQNPMPYHLATPQPGPSARTERGKYITPGGDATGQCGLLQRKLHMARVHR